MASSENRRIAKEYSNFEAYPTILDFGLLKIPRVTTKGATDEYESQRQKPASRSRFDLNVPSLLLQSFKVCLFAAGCGISLYQTLQLLTIFINQPTVASIIPVQNLTLKRPDLILCVNVYKSTLSIIHNKMNSEMLGVMGLMATDYSPLLFENTQEIFNVSNENFPYISVEDLLHSTAQNFTKCESVLGTCNTLIDASVMHPGSSCCNVTIQFTPPEGVCYRINNSEPQENPGKVNAAMYELKFPETTVGLVYDIYLAANEERISTQQQPITSVSRNQEVNIEVQKVVRSRLNTTTKCTNEIDLVQPLCRRKVVSEIVRQLCHCEDEKPVWLFSAGELEITVQNAGNPTQLRPCRFIEGFQCGLKRAMQMKQLNAKMIKRCFDYQCQSSDFPDKTVSTTLAPYFGGYANHSEERMQFSVVYVFYGSMTITQEFEVHAHTWLSILSDLGGVWGLWLGWSLYQVAEVSMAMVTKLANKFVWFVIQSKMSVSLKQHLLWYDYFGPLVVFAAFFLITFIILMTCILYCCITDEDDDVKIGSKRRRSAQMVADQRKNH